jgi:type I restriction enzyme M protein
MFEQNFKNIDNVLYRETDSELDYIEQTSWVLFLRYLDELENLLLIKFVLDKYNINLNH